MSEYIHSIEKELTNLTKLSAIIKAYLNNEHMLTAKHKEKLDYAIEHTSKENAFFTIDSIKFMLNSICLWLTDDSLKHWLNKYNAVELKKNNAKRVGVVMAGNIPLVGFHDFLCVLLSGNIFYGKLSHQDAYMLPAIAELLFEIDSDYKERICFTKDVISGYDAIIATGSNNSARYFEYYFKDVPSIIRKNRSSVAVLTGKESIEQLEALMDDLFLYYGLGCRNVSKLFIPSNYNFTELLQCGQRFIGYLNHTKYRNNYDYYKTIFLMNAIPIIDGGFYSLKEDISMHTLVSVIHFEFYDSVEYVKNMLAENAENIQCIVAADQWLADAISFGYSQKPLVDEYADNKDTMIFLYSLNS
jgi:hypothetical protein